MHNYFNCVLIVLGGDGIKENKYKSCDDIYKELGFTQKEFAEAIGISVRSYQYRITQEQDWRLNDLISLTKLAKCPVILKSGDSEYIISIKENTETE